MATFGWFVASVILALGVGLWVNFWLPWWAGAAVGIPIAVVFQIYAYDETSGRLIPTPAGLCEISLWSAFGRSIGSRRVSPSLDPSQHDTLLPYAVALNEARQWIVDQRDQCSAALVSPLPGIRCATVALGSVKWKMLNQPIHYFSQLLLFSIC